jgi:hypothetical protein
MKSIIFPSDYNSNKKPNQFWEKEAAAAEAAGFELSFLSESHFESPLSIHNKKAKSLYRGWIIKPQIYLEFSNLGCELLNNNKSYLWSYNFPEWYSVLKDYSPESLTITGDEIVELGLDAVAVMAAKRLSGSILIKDWLKSRKHEWFDACFIRDISDTTESVRIMKNFFELQGRDFYGGLVFRNFLKLKQLGIHPKSRMPLSIEFRTFFLNKEPIFTVPYWDNDVPYTDEVKPPTMDWLKMIGQKLQSPFVALDIAQDEDDKWWVIEVNDGGFSGTPERTDLNEFYGILFDKLKDDNGKSI